MVFLILLRTQLILGEDAIDARYLPIERCWTEMFLSQVVRRWGMTSVARRLDWALFSAVGRIPLVKYWFFVRIWRNMSRAASLLRRGPCDCFINYVLPWCDACTDRCYCDAFLVSMCILDWLPNCCSPFHWGQILDSIRLEGPKECWRFRWAHEEIVMAWPGDHRPSVSRGITTSRALGREKWNLLCFPNFIK